LVLSIAPSALLAGELSGIRLSSGPSATRVVLDLDGPASHRLFLLANPDRVVIDLPGMAAGASLRLPEPKGRVRSVRTGSPAGGVFRVVLDLSGKADSKSFLLAPDGGFGHRLVIDLSDQGTRSPVKRIESDPGRNLVVVIDAGHGGSDPGAIGPSGVREKDVVLQIARRLADYLRAEPGVEPVLVRNGDRFVALHDRLRIARQAKADLFISIHADSFRNASAEGATVYVLDTGRASSETAKRLADRENAADLIGGVRIAEMDDMLARVVLDLSQDMAISQSKIAGDRVINQLSRVATMRKTRVEHGNFLVLTSPDIPSVFVESAYISNPNDESSLRDSAFQNLFAHALFTGILDYFRTHAPPGSYLAQNPPPERRGPIQHVISRGETLSEIAERYRISLRALRQTNQINGDVIRVGQVLTIPTT
jgi:N-acetylmuramoyl-L-alanine amidase